MGKPAARVGDMHVCPIPTHVGGPVLPPGKVNVLIGGMPAARVTDRCTCVGPPDMIIQGSSTVLIGGLPAARMGDMTVHGGRIVLGCFTVLIGDSGGGGTAFVNLSDRANSTPTDRKPAQAMALARAAQNGTPFVEMC